MHGISSTPFIYFLYANFVIRFMHRFALKG